MIEEIDRKALAASLIGCQRDELLGFRDEGLSGVVLIAPDGSKHILPEELLRRAAAWLVDIPAGQRLERQGSPAEASTPEPSSGVQALAGQRLEPAIDPEKTVKQVPIPAEPVGRVSIPAIDPVNDPDGGMANSVRPESRPTKKAPRSKKGSRP